MSLDWIDLELKKLADAHLQRHRVSRSGKQSTQIVVDGKRYISFGSNDYLGIASDDALQEVVRRTVLRSGWGSGASPLMVGRSAMHAELERRLATFFDREAALLFPSGFAANAGTIPTLVGTGDVIFSDARNHASIIDGCRLSRARVVVYPHTDASALEHLIEEHSAANRKLIVTDSLFSMDGDAAPLNELISIANRYGAMLLVDEAHAIGVLGPSGKGLASAAEDSARVDVIVGTLSKAMGSHGGFVVGSRRLIEYLANRARSYVFSTAGPVAASAVGLAALGMIRDQPQRRERLLSLGQRLRRGLAEQDWDVPREAHHIIPVMIRNTDKTVELSARLRDQGYWVPCIRPPTVPNHESLLRISLSYAHTDEMIDGLLTAMSQHGDLAAP